MSHELETPWSLYFQQNAPDKGADYASTIHKIGTFDTIEGFWAYFSHLRRTTDIDTTMEYHIFRNDTRGMWEDDENRHGGRWILFLKKQYSAQYWEKTVIALIGEMISPDILGAVISVRDDTDLLSFWTKTGRSGSNDGDLTDVAMSISRSLELPVGTRMKFRNHIEAGRDAGKPMFSFIVRGNNPRGGRQQGKKKT